MDVLQFELHARIEHKHWWFMARREIILDTIDRHLPGGEGRCVAEIGCGTGGNLAFLAPFYRVLGVDTSPEAVAFARQKLDCPVLLGDFREQLAGRWPEIDAVLIADVLEHVAADDQFLGDIVASLKPGGLVIITVPAHRFLWSSHDAVLGHVRRYSGKQLRRLWQGLPVTEQFLSPFNSILFPLIAASRVLLPDRKQQRESDLRLPSPLVNLLLYRLFSLERVLLRMVPLPIGVSYIAVLKKD